MCKCENIRYSVINGGRNDEGWIKIIDSNYVYFIFKYRYSITFTLVQSQEYQN